MKSTFNNLDKDEDKGGFSGNTNPLDSVIHTGRDSGSVEEKYNRRIGNRRVRIQDSRRVFDKSKEGI